MTTFIDLLDRYRASSLSEAEKGTKFEELMRSYLLALPKYRGLVYKVWLWGDFPFRKDFGSGHDLGIDLVALTSTGEYWAVQCKCYREDAYITKEAVDTFLSTSGKRFSDDTLEPRRFSRRLWIATTDRWSENAETSLVNQEPPVMRIGLAALVSSPVDWAAVEGSAHAGRAGAPRTPPLPPRSPYEHQLDAIAAAHAHFATHDRGKLIMACGTGKTYTSLKIAEKEVKPTGLVLFLVPSIALLGQTLNEWTANAEKPIRPMCVCSDADVSKKQKASDDGGFTVEELAFPASTDVDSIVRQFRELDLLAKTNGGFRVVFSTYQSLPQVVAAQRALNAEKAHQADFDLVICDEAHRTTGAAAKDAKQSAFILVHANSNLAAKKRLLPKDARGIPLICSRQAMVKEFLAGWFGCPFGKLDVVANYNLIYNAAVFVEAGLGAAVCIDGMIPQEFAERVVFRPFAPELVSDVYLAWRKNAVLSPAAAAFVATIREMATVR